MDRFWETQRRVCRDQGDLNMNKKQDARIKYFMYMDAVANAIINGCDIEHEVIVEFMNAITLLREETGEV